MTRTEKVMKLGNAIRDYRGAHINNSDPHADKVWIYPPKPMEKPRVIRAIQRLNLNVPETLMLIDGFKKLSEFRQWIQSL